MLFVWFCLFVLVRLRFVAPDVVCFAAACPPVCVVLSFHAPRTVSCYSSPTCKVGARWVRDGKHFSEMGHSALDLGELQYGGGLWGGWVGVAEADRGG